MKTKSSKFVKEDPFPKVVVSEQMRQSMLAIAVRNEDAFVAIRKQFSDEAMRRVGHVYAIIWKAAADYYEQYHRLPDYGIMTAEASRVVEDEYYMLASSQTDHLNALVDLVYDDTAYKEPVETSKSHAKWAISTAQKLLTQLAAESFKETLSDPASLMEMPAILTAMTEQVGAIRSMATVKSGDVFATGWDVVEHKPLYSTGLKLLDEFIGGMRAGETYGFFGPYGSCKTTVAVQAIVESAKQCSATYEQLMATYAAARAAWKEGGKVGPAPERPKKPMVFYASYETPIGEFRERVLAYMANVPRKRLMAMDHRGVKSLRGPGEEPIEYEKHLYAAQIEGKVPFPSEQERVLTSTSTISKFVVFMDMTGKTEERQEKGKGGVPELAADMRVELAERDAKLYCLWLDHAASMCEEYMIASNTDSSDRRNVLRRIPKQLGTMIAGPMDGAVFVLQQLSGEANSRRSSANIDHTDSDECKSFGMYLDFAITCTRPNADQICIFRCTKHRRTPPLPHKFVKVIGDFNRVEDVSSNYTIEGGGLGIVDKAKKNMVSAANDTDDIYDSNPPPKKKSGSDLM